MAKLCRAILIDPEMRRMKAIKCSGQPSEVRELIGAGGLEFVRLADHGDIWDYGWFDDNALLRGNPVYAFKFYDWRNPIPGKCLVVGTDKASGDTVDAGFDYILLCGVVYWLGLILPEVTWDRGPNGVMSAIITYSRVKANV